MKTRSSHLKIESALAAILLVATVAADTGIVYFQGHVNGKVTGFEKTDVAMFQTNEIDSKYYSEVWFHELQFADEGVIVNINFQRNNWGLSNGYLDAYLLISDPDTLAIVEQWHGDAEDFNFAAEGFQLKAGPHELKLDGDTYHLKFKGEKMSADMTYQILVPSFQQGDGKVVFGNGEFVRYNFPIPWAEVSGTLTYNGKTRKLKGMGSMNHDWQDLSPLRFPTVWRAFWIYDEELTVGIVNCTASDFNGEWARRLMVAEKGKVLFSSHDFKLTDLDFQPVPGGNVPLPRRFQVEARHGNAWLTGEIRVTRIQEKKEALAEAPALLRKVASYVIDELWSYRFWMDYDLEFHQDGKTRALKGRGVGDFVDSVESAQ